MFNRNSWGCPYFVVRGEILGFTEDERLRKHSPRMFSLTKTVDASQLAGAKLKSVPKPVEKNKLPTAEDIKKEKSGA